MNYQLISLRNFVAEISGSILSANELLQTYQSSCLQEHSEAEQEWIASSAPLRIKQVLVSFSAQAINPRRSESSTDGMQDILLNFMSDPRKQPTNLHAKILFAGDGEPVTPERRGTREPV